MRARYQTRLLVIIAIGALGLLSAFAAETPKPERSANHSVKVRPPFLPKAQVPKSKSGAKSISVLGGSVWQFEGPAPTTGGQTENVTPNNEVDGAVEVVVPHPTNPNIMWLGAVNGGVWKTTNATSASPTWTPLTDSAESLSIGALELDPTDGTHNTLVAGTGWFSSFAQIGGDLTGLLKTTDGGTNWTAISDPLLVGASISGIAERGSTIVVAANANGFTDGVFRSINGGSSWTAVSGTNGLPTGAAFYLAGDPSNLSRLYVAIRHTGIYRSDDTGGTWINVSAGNAALNNAITSSSNNNAKMAVAANGRIFAGIIINGQPQYIGYSSDQGGTWTSMDLPRTAEGTPVAVTGATNASPIVITSPNHGLPSDETVRIVGVTGNTAANGVWTITAINANQFSLDGSIGNGSYAGGGTWQVVVGLSPEVEPGGQGAIHFAITTDPSNFNLVYVAGDRQDTPFPNSLGALDYSGRLFRGDITVTPTGAIPSPQWTSLTHNGTASNSAPHADSRALAFDANGNLINGNDGGVYRRSSPQNGTGNWTSINGNLGVTELHSIAYDSVSHRLIGGAQDTGTPQQTSQNGLTWETISSGDGGKVAVNDSSPTLSFRYSSYDFLFDLRVDWYNASGAFVTETVPALTVTGGGDPLDPQFYTPLVLNSINPSQFIIAATNGVYESLNGGSTLTEIGPGIQAVDNGVAYGSKLSGAPAAYVLYVTDGFEVYSRSTSGGALNFTPVIYPGLFATGIDVDPANGSIAYVSDYYGSVYRSNSFGASWTDITGNLPFVGTIWSVATVPLNGATGLVIGTNAGIYASTDLAPGVWHKIGTNFPNALAFDLEYDSRDNVLAVGTVGRGAWLLPNASSFVEPDPRVLSITTSSLNTIDVTFSRPMDPDALVATGYTLTGFGLGTLAAQPDSVTSLGGNVYRLTWNTGAMVAGLVTLYVSGVHDAFGVPVSSFNNATTSTNGPLAAYEPAPDALVLAGILLVIGFLVVWRLRIRAFES